MLDEYLGDSAALFGDVVQDDGKIYYGPLVLTTAPKEGKANTLLADHLFSPSLLLAERIERGLIPLQNKTVIELGAGCALPSLLASTLPIPPTVVVITDYPDETILGNLHDNVTRNRDKAAAGCSLLFRGYEWGQDASPLLELSPAHAGFDVVILSDLLHFDRSHDVLLASLRALLRADITARTYVAAGKYTPPHVCAHFVQAAARSGIVLEEGEESAEWLGTLPVSGSGLDREQLGVRKGMCRWWVGRWASDCAGPAVS
ncbi:uncharacterized protein LAESUDRAFT_684554 [Laetiporus sulphureus 93-53]|uniref:Uncharacterized protein n=1 Tax=Laetiporus sulphureus 93-53 TaxID=1314785 RepID=A0A165CKF1_9APHY|nr:uncharacterized protein LAESUDRAFT_684554 [Laetiporus sulphureus 93-53]KZT02974.1 hypothetical protein LAESUDRAFT_684554 [Laetiporus sulphureus 93-53]